MHLPHISLGNSADGRVTVTTDDTEVYDLVEDYLVEKCNLEPEEVLFSEANAVQAHTMFFPRTVTKEHLQGALEKLDADEIERVFRLNNG